MTKRSHATSPHLESDGKYPEAISTLPLSPVNCARALVVDDHICGLTRASQVYIVTAPLTCPSCGCKRKEDTRNVWDNGIIMCTIGACRMIIEEFRCSSFSCNRAILAEGREHCVLIHTLSSGATHALLRRELYGVVISNGTLTGRLSHYHSLVTANAFFGIVPNSPPSVQLKHLYGSVLLC